MPTTVEPAVLVGERLRAARVLIGASQTELAAAVGVSQAQVSHVESGRRGATPELLDRVAAATESPRSFFDAVPADLASLTLRFRRRTTARSAEV